MMLGLADMRCVSVVGDGREQYEVHCGGRSLYEV